MLLKFNLIYELTLEQYKMRHDTNITIYLVIFFSLLFFIQCSEKDETPSGGGQVTDDPFYFGVDLSYVNQILDHGGIYKDGGARRTPYRIFLDNGADLVRLRLWHNPTWTKDVYGNDGQQLYNDLKDVEQAIALSKQHEMQVLLDFHYSDTWADPDTQEIPAAWINITDPDILEDSVYNYTFKTLKYLDKKGLLPDFVQIGNEINCGMLYSNAPTGFPTCNACDGQWKELGDVINSAIKAVRDVSSETKIILHVADPKNVEWWFDNVQAIGLVTDYDIIGFSYYPLWHTTVSIPKLSDNISNFKSKYGKEVMILETAYPWTKEGNDNYSNIFGDQDPVPGFEFTPVGQFEILKKLTEEVKAGGGLGIIYWEPAWISSDMKDLWGTGSAWENCALFDFNGETNLGIDFISTNYQ
ncbi:MAG TPA: glycosyl hydrolase 53 family protein [Cyclobacteriaceae bacterium]|nr:glycosyl hydrolase 53 family protein [Cyclobacteriaceae bacterium]